MSNPSNRASMRGQLTLRGVVIGVLGCVIITASSAYTALKMGALPWPIVFAAVISLFFLKLMGNASLNEANVTHTIMSAGAMVAGGLAFTIPGAWMLGYADQISWLDMFIVALAGTILGLLATALIHRHFIVDAALEFPTGNAAAQTLRATEAGGKTGKQLFGSMAIAGIYSVLRDALGVVPSMLCTLNIPGVTFAIYNSPMLLSIGFLVGFAPVAFWFAGALLGNFGIIVGGTAAGLFDVMTAQGIVKSLGMGLMMGFGVAVVLKDILPQVAGIVRGLAADSSTDTDEQSLISGSLLKVQDVGDVGAAPAVNGLVIVAYDHEVLVLGGQQVSDLVLDVVGVLVLVDANVAEALLVLFEHLGAGAQQLKRAHEQVVEVHRIGGAQAALQLQVDLRGLFIVGAIGALEHVLGADHGVFGRADLAADHVDGELLLLDAERLHNVTHHAL